MTAARSLWKQVVYLNWNFNRFMDLLPEIVAKSAERMIGQWLLFRARIGEARAFEMPKADVPDIKQIEAELLAR